MRSAGTIRAPSVGTERPAKPTPREMTAQAQITGIGRVLIRDGHIGLEQEIPCGMGHHAALPVGERLDSGVVVAMAIGAAVRIIQLGAAAKWLSARHIKIPQGCWHPPPGRRNDGQSRVALVLARVGGVIYGDNADTNRIGGRTIGGEPGERTGVRQANRHGVIRGPVVQRDVDADRRDTTGIGGSPGDVRGAIAHERLPAVREGDCHRRRRIIHAG